MAQPPRLEKIGPYAYAENLLEALAFTFWSLMLRDTSGISYSGSSDVVSNSDRDLFIGCGLTHAQN